MLTILEDFLPTRKNFSIPYIPSTNTHKLILLMINWNVQVYNFFIYSIMIYVAVEIYPILSFKCVNGIINSFKAHNTHLLTLKIKS